MVGPPAGAAEGGEEPALAAKLRVAGVASVLPTASLARTPKVCGPSARTGGVNGEPQGEKPSSSIWHSKLAPVSLEKAKVGVGSLVGPAGPESIEVSGELVSIVKPRNA